MSQKSIWLGVIFQGHGSFYLYVITWIYISYVLITWMSPTYDTIINKYACIYPPPNILINNTHEWNVLVILFCPSLISLVVSYK